jgi:hypothetical protein
VSDRGLYLDAFGRGFLKGSSGGKNFFTLVNESTGVDSGMVINFNSGPVGPTGRTLATVGHGVTTNSSDDDGYLFFSTRGSDVESERMRITNTGDVGIGTTTPTEKLEVNGNIRAVGSITGQVETDSDTLATLTLDFANTNIVRATGAAAACGTLDVTNVTAGGTYTATILNATATCTTIHLNGSATNVKLPAGYTGGESVSGVVYTFLYDGLTLWMTYVPY